MLHEFLLKTGKHKNKIGHLQRISTHSAYGHCKRFGDQINTVRSIMETKSINESSHCPMGSWRQQCRQCNILSPQFFKADTKEVPSLKVSFFHHVTE